RTSAPSPDRSRNPGGTRRASRREPVHRQATAWIVRRARPPAARARGPWAEARRRRVRRLWRQRRLRLVRSSGRRDGEQREERAEWPDRGQDGPGWQLDLRGPDLLDHAGPERLEDRSTAADGDAPDERVRWE